MLNLDRIERLQEIVLQVFHVLDADRESHQGVADAELRPLRRRAVTSSLPPRGLPENGPVSGL